MAVNRAAAVLALGFVAGASVAANSRLLAAEKAQAQRLDAFVDALARSQARSADLPEQGTPLLAGFPHRERWEACRERLSEPGCEASRRAALAFPPTDPEAGRELLEQLGLEGWSEGPENPAATVVAWGSQDLDPAGQQLLALSTATLLGSPPPPGPLPEAAERASKGVAVPGGSAPTQPFPPPANPEEVASATVSGERLLRGGPGTQDHAAPRGALVAGIRAGEAIDPATWKKPGLSGLAALEVGRAGRLEDLDAVLALSVTGPTPADRLAGLWAGLLLAPPETWANSEARDRATALQGAASR